MGSTFAEYIWIDGTDPTQCLRSKTKVIVDFDGTFPVWGFDGSSTNQAAGDDSDCHLQPVSHIPDPIRGDGHWLVMCEVLLADGETPHPTNTRAPLRKVLEAGGAELDAWFGLEQEYTLFDGSRPLGFGEDRRYPPAQGPYYCGVGADQVYGRELVEDHMRACAASGIKISGINAEVMPGQWEYQVGPVSALEAGDQLWLSRWLLYRMGEEYGINATLDPKPVPGDWNGAGLHTNFSTAAMRREGGMEHITAWCEAASQRIDEHLAVYGDGIEMRLTGRHETCSFREFKYGVGDRTASIRIPLGTAQVGYGYLEDRRPNANADPYAIAGVMLQTAANLW
ncbi:MAG: glutamine synthetase beta-grasp domain-containing protein [Myxococcota bacterium]|nr:glutamine synthetase beta-grasp domain-containing protein [Myxococcota bacterium]